MGGGGTVWWAGARGPRTAGLAVGAWEDVAVGGDELRSGAPAGTVVVPMPEELDHSNAAQVRLELAAAFVPGVTAVVADLTPTAFCDSSGFGEIVWVHKHAAAAGVALRVVAPHRYMTDYLARVGLAGYLSVYRDLPAALAAGGPLRGLGEGVPGG
jgi:anti-sigma B factor antagonist